MLKYWNICHKCVLSPEIKYQGILRFHKYFKTHFDPFIFSKLDKFLMGEHFQFMRAHTFGSDCAGESLDLEIYLYKKSNDRIKFVFLKYSPCLLEIVFTNYTMIFAQEFTHDCNTLNKETR